MSGIHRYYEILAEHQLRPFERIPWVNPRTERVEPRVLGQRVPVRWRISHDEWDRLVAWAKDTFNWPSVSDNAYLAGFLVVTDDALPPHSIILEPDE